jgi:hypothetical protein
MATPADEHDHASAFAAQYRRQNKKPRFPPEAEGHF